MRVVICGSTHWAYNSLVKDEVLRLKKEAGKVGKKLLIIHGGEPGPEAYAGYVCRELGIDIIIHEAVRLRGDNCYYRRNQIMLKYHKPDLVVYFAPIL